MTAFRYLLLILLGYAALIIWVAPLTRAFRLRQTPLAGALLVLPRPSCSLSSSSTPAAPAASRRSAPRPDAGGGEVPCARRGVAAGAGARPTLLHLVLLSGSALFLVPFAWLVVTSLKTDAQMAVFPPVWVPHPVLWRNYPDALKFLPPDSDFGLVNLENTLIIAVMSVIGTVLSSSLVAYGFARLRWPGRDWLFGRAAGDDDAAGRRDHDAALSDLPRPALDRHAVAALGALVLRLRLQRLSAAPVLPGHPAGTGGRRQDRRLRAAGDLLARHAAAGQAGAGRRRHHDVSGRVEGLHGAADLHLVAGEDAAVLCARSCSTPRTAASRAC